MKTLLIAFAFIISSSALANSNARDCSARCSDSWSTVRVAGFGGNAPENYGPRGACEMGEGLVKAGVPLERAIEICNGNLSQSEVTVHTLIQKGLINRGNLSALQQTKTLTAVCSGAAAQVAACQANSN
jgi:hypothetical protein